jgi:RNA polymerase sigma-70 factor (family 1)
MPRDKKARQRDKIIFGSNQLGMKRADQQNEEFHQAFTRYGDGLYYYVLKLTGDPEKAKDIVQECFLRLWENIQTIDMQKDLLPLLVTYIRHLLIDEFRKTQRHQQAIVDLQQDTINTGTVPEIEQRLDLQDTERRLADTLSTLPEKRQAVFHLVRQEGLSYREVAEELKLSLPDVKKQMRLGLQVLRKIMQLMSFFPVILF